MLGQAPAPLQPTSGAHFRRNLIKIIECEKYEPLAIFIADSAYKALLTSSIIGCLHVWPVISLWLKLSFLLSYFTRFLLVSHKQHVGRCYSVVIHFSLSLNYSSSWVWVCLLSSFRAWTAFWGVPVCTVSSLHVWNPYATSHINTQPLTFNFLYHYSYIRSYWSPRCNDINVDLQWLDYFYALYLASDQNWAFHRNVKWIILVKRTLKWNINIQ